METNKTFSRSNKSILNGSLRATQYPFTACSSNLSRSGRSLLTSASGDSTATSWDSIRSSLLNYNAPERNLLEQGLVTPRRREYLEYRQIRDKSYYMGIIHRKGYEISSEIKKLFKDVGIMAADESTYVSYKIRAQTQASEVKNFQDILADYNMVDDFCNTEVSLHIVKNECNRMKSENEKEISELETLFELRKEKEVLVTELEEDIGYKRRFSNILDPILNPELCDRYKRLKKKDTHLKMNLRKLEQELRLLNSEKATFEKLCLEPKNKEACLLLSKLYDEVKKRDVLFKEQSFQFTPQEMDALQERNDEYKELLSCLLEDIRSVKTQIEQVRCELSFNNNNEANSVLADKGSKLNSLKRRENIMDSFLTSFPKKQSAMLSEHSKLQYTIIRLLEKMSERPNSDTLDCTSSNTMNPKLEEVKDVPKQELFYQFTNLSLEDKLQIEKTNKHENMKKDNEKIFTTFSLDAGELKNAANENILNEADSLRKKRNIYVSIVKDLQNYRDVLLNKINKSELFMQLSNLEDRWKSLEQKNFAIKEELADAKIRSDYHSLKFKVMETLYDFNEMLTK